MGKTPVKFQKNRHQTVGELRTHGSHHLFNLIVQNALKWLSSNKNIKMSSFKSSENIQKKEGGPDRSTCGKCDLNLGHNIQGTSNYGSGKVLI